MDKNKQVTPAAKPAAKTRRVSKPAAAKPLPGLPSEPKPIVAAPAAKPVVAESTLPLTPPVAKPAAPVAPANPVIAPVAASPAPPPEPETPAPAVPAPVAQAPEPVVAAPEPSPAPSSSPTAAVPAEPKPKEIIMEATSTIENATAKTQAFFGDAQARTQAAMEKSAKLFEDMVAFNKDNLEAVVESSKIAAKGAETLGQGAADYAKRSFETATQTLQTLSSVKSPTEFLKLQSDFARSSFDSIVAETSRSTEHMMKLAGEIAQPLSNRFAVAAEKMKTVA